ncbi:MAG: restriction endonuclease subunit S [Muribaculaceae bacterium]|nr:restriction endonuclease subunit S [Muribaculaceae bacterium]
MEYKKLGIVTEMKRGTSATKKDLLKGLIPVISGGKEPAFYCDRSNRTGEIITVAGSGASAGYVQYWNTPIFVNDAFSVKGNEKLLTKYIFYFLSSIQDKIYTTKKGGGVPHVHISSIENFLIPAPPIEIQREVVRILDIFTECIELLEKELELRKKQYSYYRDKLLNFGNDIECKLLGELFKIKNGLNKEKSAFGKGKPIINFTDVYKNRWLAKDSFSGLVDVTPNEIKRYSAKKGDVFFTRTSETKEDIGMSSTLIEDVPDCVFSGFVLRARPITTLLIPKFCAYYFSTHNVRSQIIKYASFTTRATTTGEKLSKINIPIPPIEEQVRIVKILYKFDTLCNDLTNGIPAEISARKKQYEYYRDKIFDFKRR